MKKTAKFFLEKLMKLPHRGNNTPEIRKATEIIFKEYKEMGFVPEYVEFKTAESGAMTGVLTTIFFLAALFFIWFELKWLGVFFYIFGCISYTGIPPILDTLFIRIKPYIAKSIFVQIFPEGEIKKTLVFCGHFDTPREAKGINILKLINKTFIGKRLFNSNEKAPFLFRGPLFLLNITIIMLGFLFFIPLKTKIGFILFLIVFFLLTLAFFVNLQISLSKPVPGAFDNGSGAAAVMALAARLAEKKIQNTRLIFFNNPGEEGCIEGFREFFKKANIDKTKTHFIVLDGVGAKNLKIAFAEISNALGIARHFDRELYNFTIQFIKKEKKFESIKERFLPLLSDASNIMKRGGRVGFALFSVNDDGFVDHYHQMSDTIDKINFQTLELCCDFLESLIREIDTSFYGYF